ncbi:MAG: hypothetical protein ABSG21_10850 [Spirochaetia bacterium]|jgi:hypothetical protein
MTPSPVGGHIRLAIQNASSLHPGETVVVHVIKRLDAGKWAVGVRGKVYPASSELPLEQGAVLRARVSGSAGKLVLTVSDVVPDALLVALQLQGLPRGGLEEIIARTLARSGLPLLPETIQKVKALLTRAGLDDRKSARSAVTLVDKRIDPASPGAAALLRVLAFGQKGGEDPRRYRGRPLPETPRGVKEFADSIPAQTGSKSSALQAFNHSAGRTQSWVVIPFVFATGARKIAGTLKILFDAFKSRPLALTLATEGIALYLPLQGRRRSLSVYCDSERLKRAAVQGLDSLRSKFHNMGLEVDDTVKEGNAFDGFTPVEEEEILPSVDTVG